MRYARQKRLPYNARKRLILAALDSIRLGGLRADAIAWKVGISPQRAIYGRLNRLAGWGLVERRRGADGRFLYGLTARGRDRLAWLRHPH